MSASVSEKAPKFCKIFTLLLSYVEPVKSKFKISQNFVAFSEYMNFIYCTKEKINKKFPLIQRRKTMGKKIWHAVLA